MTKSFRKLFSKKRKPNEVADSDSPPDTPEEELDERPWIGVDLDGTLAQYPPKSILGGIGKPVPLMQRRLLEWVHKGCRVKIVTARASVPGGDEPVRCWLQQHGFPDLEITNEKDFLMLELWDDRAIQVVANTGKPVLRPSGQSNPKSPLFSEEDPGNTCFTVGES